MKKYATTAGDPIYEIINCDCGLTGGCKRCNPFPSFIGSITDKEAKSMKKKVADFSKRFNRDFEEKHKRLFLEPSYENIDMNEKEKAIAA